MEAQPDLAIFARNLGVKYNLRLTRERTLRRTLAGFRPFDRSARTQDFWALRSVDLVVRTGETVGVIGRNGSGKSTLLLTIAGVIGADEGSIRTFGQRTTLLTLGAGFEPELTGRENIYLNAAYLGLARRAIVNLVDPIVEFSELGEFIDAPLKTYSTGMRARLGFAIAAHTRPDILLLDEVLSVGDAGFQAKSRIRLHELMEHARALVIVSHNLEFLASTCTKALWLDAGEVRAFDEVGRVIAMYNEATVRQTDGNLHFLAPQSEAGQSALPGESSEPRLGSSATLSALRAGRHRR